MPASRSNSACTAPSRTLRSWWNRSGRRVRRAGEIVMVHGLEGSGRAVYIRSLSAAALRAGFAAHRYQHAHLRRHRASLPHALPRRSHQRPDWRCCANSGAEGRGPIFLVGFSLGGNVVVKLAGELGESGPELLGGVCAVSAPLDLAACSRRLSQPENRIYQRRFVKRMRERLWPRGGTAGRISRASTAYSPSTTASPPLRSASATPRIITARNRPCATWRALRVPVLLIHAKDDTLVPFEPSTRRRCARNPWIERLPTEHGGHLGFLGRRPHRFWLDDGDNGVDGGNRLRIRR